MPLRKRLLSTLALLALSPAFAQSPAAQPGQAEWIGIATPPAPDFTHAAWIWADSPGIDPTQDAKPGTVVFRRPIDLPTNAAISSAYACIAADDRFKFALNGKVLGTGDRWQTPVMIDLAGALRPGANALVIEVRNDESTGTINAAGLIGKIRIDLAGMPAREIVTDAAWTSTESAATAKPVKVIGPLGSGPWSALTMNPAAADNNLPREGRWEPRITHVGHLFGMLITFQTNREARLGMTHQIIQIGKT